MDCSASSTRRRKKTKTGADKGSAKETKEQYVENLLEHLQTVNKLSQEARDVLNAAEAEDVDSEEQRHRDVVIESMMTAEIAKIMEEFHECEEGPQEVEETAEELGNLNVSRSLSPVETGGAKKYGILRLELIWEQDS